MKRERQPRLKQPQREREEGGFAMLWSLIGMMGLTFLGVAAHHISRNEAIISENFEVEEMGLYAADGAISQFLATFAPTSEVTDAEVEYDPDAVAEGGDPSESEGELATALEDFSGADLIERNYGYGVSRVTVTPIKVTESRFGDVYMIEAVATIEDARGEPTADRVLRTFARLNPFIKVWGAMTAPNGVETTINAEHLHLDGKAKGKCGGEDIPPLTVPEGGLDLDDVDMNKLHLKPAPKGLTGQDLIDATVDTTTSDYDELVDSLGMQVSWEDLINPVTYGGNVIIIPDDYPNLESIPVQPKKTYPTVLVKGDLDVRTKVKMQGSLIVEGVLTVGPDDGSKLDWKGAIITGKQMEVLGEAHLHAKGGVITGLDCTNGEIQSGNCRNLLDGKHMGVKYQPCDLEAAMSNLMTLRQVTPSRHTRLF